MTPRAKVTFEEDARGAVHVQVLTSERLGTFELAGFLRYEPADYLQRAISIECWRDAGTGILLAEIRASNVATKLSDRYLDVSNGSEERRRLGLLVRQEDVRVVWPNEKLDFPLSLEPARREYLACRRALRQGRPVHDVLVPAGRGVRAARRRERRQGRRAGRDHQRPPGAAVFMRVAAGASAAPFPHTHGSRRRSGT